MAKKGETINRIGQKFGKLLIVDQYRENRKTYAVCECDCGDTYVSLLGNIVSGSTVSCGCHRLEKHRKDYLYLLNTKIGNLIILKIERRKNEKEKCNRSWAYCRCDCGNYKWVQIKLLLNGHTTSCGCLHKKVIAEMMTKHGMRQTYLYQIWRGIRQRCYNPNSLDYSGYGARGIKMSDEWYSNFVNFYNDVKDWNLEKEGISIERIDNDGPYSLDNCKAATAIEQANNKRNNHFVEFDEKIKTIAQWSRFFNLDQRKLHYYLSKNSFDMEATLYEMGRLDFLFEDSSSWEYFSLKEKRTCA